MNEYEFYIKKVDRIEYFLNQIINTFKNNYSYYTLNIYEWKTIVYKEIANDDLFIPQDNRIKNIKSYCYNLVNNLIYYMQKKTNNELVSLNAFIDCLNSKNYKNYNDDILIKHLSKINGYKNRKILDNLVFAQYDNDNNNSVLERIEEYMDTGSVKQLFRYRFGDHINYRKLLIENIKPNELYGVVCGRILELDSSYRFHPKTKREVIQYYLEQLLLDYQDSILENVIHTYFDKYGLLASTKVLTQCIEQENYDMLFSNKEEKDQYKFLFKKYIKTQPLLDIISKILSKRGIDVQDMEDYEIIDIYIYSFVDVKKK